MSYLDRLERKIGWIAIPHLAVYIILGQVMAFALQMGRPNIVYEMLFIPSKVLDGEVLRIIGFIFIPPGASMLWLFFAWMVFYMIGGAMEASWGAFRFTLYILLGALVMMVTGFLFPGVPVGNSFLYLSVLLAFAWLNPNFEFMLFFVLPVKVKWLAYLAGVGLLWTILYHPLPFKVQAFASVCNYLLFFGKDIVSNVKYGKRKLAQKAEKKRLESVPFHECSECGATDISHPGREFRYREASAICADCIEKGK